MTEELTQNDAQQAIANTPFARELEEVFPVSERAKKWKKLAEAKEVKVFHNEGEVVYSDKLEALQIQIRAMENLAKLTGDVPDQSLRLKTGTGESVIFECHFGGKPNAEGEEERE